MRGALLALVLGIILSAAGYGVAAWAQKPPAPPGTNPCEHGNSGKPCKPDPQPDHGADCDPHGKGGVNEDHCLDDTTTTTTTTTTPPPPPPPTTTTTEETTTSTTPTTSTSPTTPETTLPPSDSTTIETTTEETVTTGPSPQESTPKPGPKPPKAGPTPARETAPPMQYRQWRGKPHPIVRGSG